MVYYKLGLFKRRSTFAWARCRKSISLSIWLWWLGSSIHLIVNSLYVWSRFAWLGSRLTHLSRCWLLEWARWCKSLLSSRVGNRLQWCLLYCIGIIIAECRSRTFLCCISKCSTLWSLIYWLKYWRLLSNSTAMFKQFWLIDNERSGGVVLLVCCHLT